MHNRRLYKFANKTYINKFISNNLEVDIVTYLYINLYIIKADNESIIFN